MKPKTNLIENLAELICELTRKCGIKEDYFAESFNLTPAEVRLLKMFISKPTYKIKEIRHYLRLTPGRITHILCSLEDKKIVKRQNDPKDKRNVNVSLLNDAAPFIKEMTLSYSQLNEEILKKLEKEQIESIYECLRILLEAFDKWIEKK